MSSIKDTTTQYRINTHYQYNITSVYSYIYYIILYIGSMVIPYVTVARIWTYLLTCSHRKWTSLQIYNIDQVIKVEYRNILTTKNNLLYHKSEHTLIESHVIYHYIRTIEFILYLVMIHAYNLYSCSNIYH